METKKDCLGFDRRIANSITYHAARLVRTRAVPGMDAADYEQDLATDLLHRRRSFRADVASFCTFADRVVRHRVSSITAPTLRLKAERDAVSLDTEVIDSGGSERCLQEILSADSSSDLGLQIDVRRFVGHLPSRLAETCGLLVTDKVLPGARAAGISRSTIYEHVARLREQAAASGIDIYVRPDTSPRTPVCDLNGPRDADEHVGPRGNAEMPVREASFVLSRSTNESNFSQWLDGAEPGARLEYYRGNLAMAVYAQGYHSELARLSRRARWASDRRLVHLVQLRHCTDDYSYFAIARLKDTTGAGPFVVAAETVS